MRGKASFGGWIAIGIGMGTALGVAVGMVALGIGAGAALGAVLGVVARRPR